ncbi:hypothetical protein [Acinetobacter sp.]|uniref:hypothetical protein n=1 Tax=Acinetobacter sp. TaxID=472 RepID=UPI002FC94C1E
MKFKILSLAVFSALMLSACGGGSSDSSNNTSTSNNSTSSNSSNNNSNNTNTAQQWETVRIDYWYDSHTQAVDFGVLNTKITLADGKAYATFDADDDTNEIYLTEQGEYQTFGPTNSYGALIGQMTFINNQIKLRPYSAIGSTGLEFTTTVAQRNIAGESVLSTVDPDLNWNLDYPQYSVKYPDEINTKLKAYQALKFPAGSTCLQETEYSNNQEYLLLSEAESEYKQRFNEHVEWFTNQIAQNYIKLTKFKDALAYHYSHDGTVENAHSGYAQYKDAYYTSSKEAAGVESNLANDIQSEKERINQMNVSADEKAARLAKADGLTKGCDLYNSVAANYLKQNLKF